jgi:ribosome-binding protein aMBF1 (putative translation factor)
LVEKKNPHDGGVIKPRLEAMRSADPELQAEYERLRPRFEIVKQLIGARRKANLSQRELARRVGVSQSVIGRLESGEHSPRLETVVDVAGALGMRLDVKLVRDRAKEGTSAGS